MLRWRLRIEATEEEAGGVVGRTVIGVLNDTFLPGGGRYRDEVPGGRRRIESRGVSPGCVGLELRRPIPERPPGESSSTGGRIMEEGRAGRHLDRFSLRCLRRPAAMTSWTLSIDSTLQQLPVLAHCSSITQDRYQILFGYPSVDSSLATYYRQSLVVISQTQELACLPLLHTSNTSTSVFPRPVVRTWHLLSYQLPFGLSEMKYSASSPLRKLQYL